MFLTPDVLEYCYRAGAFPMADDSGGVEFYRSNPRSILEMEDLHVSGSLKRVLRSEKFDVAVNRDFEGVIRACSERDETWLNEEIISAFLAFHEAGFAHSVEAYTNGELSGGLYGVAIGGAFMGESMFTRRADASKVCLVHLVRRLGERGFVLLDCQIQNDHLARMGAKEISEPEYLNRLETATSLPRTFV